MQINNINQNRSRRQHWTDNDKKIAYSLRVRNTEERKLLAARKQAAKISKTSGASI